MPILRHAQLDSASLHLAVGVRRILLPQKYVSADKSAYIFLCHKCMAYRMHKLSVITQRLLFVNVLALVRPSPVLLAIVNVQNPSPPKPSAA